MITTSFPDQKIYGISYASNHFSPRKDIISEQALRSGWFNSFECHSPDVLPETFRKKYAKILKKRRGGGYWIWKSWLVAHYLALLNENDILVYLDAGCTINATSSSQRRFWKYIDMVNHNRCGFLRFALSNKEKDWSNQALFDYMALHYGMRPEFANTAQLVGGILIMRNTVFVRTLFKQALQIIEEDPWLLSDRYTRTPQGENHRHDQSLLSLLYKYMDGNLILKDESFFWNSEGVWEEKVAQRYPFHVVRISHPGLCKRIVTKIKRWPLLSLIAKQIAKRRPR